MIRVVIESPYSSQYSSGISKNLAYLRAAMADCLRRGEAPYASHALYTQDGVLDDTKPEERKLGMEAGFLWGKCADKVAVYVNLGITPGMQAGIDRAKQNGIPVEYRTIQW